MARLSLAPMGLNDMEMVEMQEELAASMKYERVEMKKKAHLTEKAMNLIRAGEENNVPRCKTTEFLRSKQLSEEFISECFDKYEIERSRSELSDYSDFDLPNSLSPSLTERRTSQISAAG